MMKSLTCWILIGVATSLVSHADFVYVDATSGSGGNTTLANGDVFTPQPNGTTGADQKWELRPFASGGNVFESGGEVAENAPLLKTTLSGLVPGQSYRVYVHFWDAGLWRIRCGFTAGTTSLFASNANASGITGATGAVSASFLNYSTPPTLFTEDNRTMLAANAGVTTADANGRIEVFIDDAPPADANARTWFDGVSIGPATEGPSLPGNALEIAPDGVWTWYNDERAIFHQGSLFAGYVKTNGQYGITRYDPVSNQSFHTIVSTATSQQQDDHNNPSITPLADGRLMILYSKHGAEMRYYQRTSLVPLPSSLADWGPEIILTTPAKNTYANTYRLTAESNRIYNFHRCINFNPTLTISDDGGTSWQAPVHFIDNGTGTTRPYVRYCSNHADRIDLIYTDGHPRDANNSLYHLFYQGGAFHRSDGSVLSTVADLPIDHAAGERGSVIYPYTTAAWGPGQDADDYIPSARAWTWDIHYGKDGNPVCVFQAQRDNVTGTGWNHDRIYYYYARWTGSSWEKKFIAHAGRPIYESEDDYGGGMSIDPDDPGVVYFSSNAANPFNLADLDNVPLKANSRYELYRGVTRDGGQTFTWEQLTVNSPADNLRPIVPEGHGYDRAVLWFHGTYTTYTNYNCRVFALLENDLRSENFEFTGNEATLSWRSSPGRNYRITATSDLPGFPIEAVPNAESQGSSTTWTFPLPAELVGSSKAFFRVEGN